MKRIPREDALVYGPDASLRPALEVRAGEPFAVETEDASLGHLTAGDRPPTPENTLMSRMCPRRRIRSGAPSSSTASGRAAASKAEIFEINLAPWGVTYSRPAPLASAADWAEEFEHSRREAYLTVGLNPDFHFVVHQMTAIGDVRFVVGAALPRRSAEGRA